MRKTFTRFLHSYSSLKVSLGGGERALNQLNSCSSYFCQKYLSEEAMVYLMSDSAWEETPNIDEITKMHHDVALLPFNSTHKR